LIFIKKITTFLPINNIMPTLQQFYQENHAKKYHFPHLPHGLNNINDEFRWITQQKIPYLPLNISGPWHDMLQEARAVDHMFVDHRGTSANQGWSSLCIHGLGAELTDAAGAYAQYRHRPDSELPYHWTTVADACPTTAEYFRTQFPYSSYLRLRYMRLAPGGYILPHHDSTNFMLGAVNISLNNPRGCEMVLEAVGVVPFEDSGTVMAFNNSYEHIVWNQSSTTRYHIIVHGTWDRTWPTLVTNSYKQYVTP
jgi:hypothetical protein